MTGHIAVLLREVLALLRLPRAGRILDCTFGGGGHSRALLEADAGIRVDALDRDPAAGERAREFQNEFPGRFRFFDCSFGQAALPEEACYEGVLFDLGVSSFHLDQGERGFSFRQDGPADMRMDPRSGMTAADFLESAPESELVRAVRDYGEEPRWRAVVRAIIGARGTGMLARTGSLAEVVRKAAEGKPWSRIDGATRTFQGIRIAVNRELEELEAGLEMGFERLVPGGVLAAISFHSLEDRLVKRFCRRMAGMAEHEDDALPQQMRERRGELLTKRPTVPMEDEMERNPRSRSAKLRAIRKLEVGFQKGGYAQGKAHKRETHT